jgi:VIT1/CCC1 family predicted Fe2+/Mn2+ transporter
VVIIVLGFANLLADAFSMAVSNYQGVQTRQDEVERARRTEHRHIEKVPHGEREEIRQIFAAKGFEGELLERVVHVITSNRDVWVNTMLTDELGIHPVTQSPLRAALATFGAFLLVGAAPLLPFLILIGDGSNKFLLSGAAAACAFFAVGAFRGHMLQQNSIRAGMSTLLTGGAAAAVAYVVGWWLRRQFGVAV